MLSRQTLRGWPRPSFSGRAEPRNLVKFWLADTSLRMSNSVLCPTIWFAQCLSGQVRNSDPAPRWEDEYVSKQRKLARWKEGERMCQAALPLWPQGRERKTAYAHVVCATASFLLKRPPLQNMSQEGSRSRLHKQTPSFSEQHGRR